MLDNLLQDIRYGLRVLRGSPVATLSAVASLALGIGANTSMFTIVNAVLLRPIPVERPHELAYVFSGTRDNPWSTTSYPTYVDYRDRNEVFSRLAAYGEIDVSLSAEDSPELVHGAIATGNYFDVLGVRAIRGRTIAPADDRPQADPVVVISYSLWMRRFGGDVGIVGRELTINGRPSVVIGVTPRLFRGSNQLENIDLYVPMAMQPLVRPPRAGFSGEMDPDLLTRRGSGWLQVIGRLRPGITLDEAKAGMDTIAVQLQQAYPDTTRGRIASVYPVSRIDPRGYPMLRNAAFLLMAVVGLVLLIATANVASLLFARAVARRREIAIRLAIGGSRARLIRQFLTESLLLAFTGAAVGLLAASWALDALMRAVPSSGPFSFTLDIPIDARVLAFTTVIAAAASVLVGLAPAVQASRQDVVPALQAAAPLSVPGRARLRSRDALVVAQVAMSIVLLVLAGVFLRSFWRAQGIRPGFAVEEIDAATLRIDVLKYSRVRGQQFYRDVLDRVEALPGTRAASLARVVPLSGGGRTDTLRVRGVNIEPQLPGDGPNLPTVGVNVTGPRYFETMGIGLVSGRDFSRADVEGAPPVVVVNETFAATYLSNRQAIGSFIALGGGAAPWREVVGVVRDSKYRTLGELPTPFVYEPLAQQHETGMTLLVRTTGDPRARLGEIRRALLDVEPQLPVSEVEPLQTMVADSLFPARAAAVLITLFGVLAAMLAAIGLYGVMSFAVSRRTREMGIRMALGARARDIRALVLRDGLALVAVGIAIGWPMAAVATRLVSGFVYAQTLQASTFIAVAAGLVMVMLVAAYAPARRASNSTPLQSLRAD